MFIILLFILQEFNNNTNNKRTIITPFELPRQPFSNANCKLFDTIVQEQVSVLFVIMWNVLVHNIT